MNIRKLPFVNILRKPGRTIALVLLTALLGFSVFGGSMLVLSLQRGLKSLESRLGADIIVVPSSAQSKASFKNMLLQGTTGAFYMSRENLKRIREVDGVEQASEQVFLASLKADCCSIKIQVIGFNPGDDFIIQPWIAQSCKGAPGHLDLVTGCNVGTDVGEILKIYDIPCHVTGRLDATGTGLDSAVYCNLDTMKTLLEAAQSKGISHDITSVDDAISAVYVKVKEGYDVGKVNSAIQGHTRRASAVKSRSMFTDVSDSLTGIAGTISWLIAAVWILAFTVLLIAFTMMVNERKKEFALLRLLGTSKRKLKKMVRKETALCSAAGGIIGVGIAALCLFPFRTLIEKSLGMPYLSPSFPVICLIAAGALAGSILAGTLASSRAASRLSKADPGTVMREE